MAGRKTTAKSSSAANGGSNGHHPKGVAGSALAQAPKKTGRGKAEGSRRTQPTADELGRRAWEATYKNRQKSRRA
jgi:hypothetical protein